VADRAGPAGGLLSPWVALAVGLLLFNDHWGKQHLSGWWPGKLSDFAGMAFFPLALQALYEVALSWAGRWRGPSRRALVASAVATGVVFSAINLHPLAADGYRWGLAALQWPLRALAGRVARGAAPPLAPVYLSQDPSDLIALPLLAVAVAVGWRR